MAPPIRLAAGAVLDEAEIEERFIRASGPGGQNVNKLSTAVELRFDAARSPGLRADVRDRLIALAGRRVTQEGVIVILAQRFRTQEANRRDARERLFALIRDAAPPPTPRKATRPTRASEERRIASKIQRGSIKAARRGPSGDD